jgi:putative two-component system response regulator
MHRILICEDDPSTLELLGDVLNEAGYKVTLCGCAESTLEHIQAHGWPHLAVIDVNLPKENGLDLCHRLQALHPSRQFPVILMTSAHGPVMERKAFQAGGADFLHKPFAPESLIHRVRNHLQLAEQRMLLRTQVESQTIHIVGLQNVITFALTSLCGKRDLETGKHIIRTQLYAQSLARNLARDHSTLNREKIQLIFRHAPLHDIGKIAIPDRILLKPGKLTPEEFKVIQTHPETGFKALQEAEDQAHLPLQELEVAKNIILSHHERWDGKGYPQGLYHQDIPLEARIMSVCDVYDALRSHRVYKPSFPHEESVQILLKGSGTQFDPDVIAAFLECAHEFHEISENNSDCEEDYIARAKLLSA